MLGRDDDYVSGLERAHRPVPRRGRCAGGGPLRVLDRPQHAVPRPTGSGERAGSRARTAARRRRAGLRRARLSAHSGLAGADGGGDYEAGYATAAEAAAIGERFGDADLVWLARDEQARALAQAGTDRRRACGSWTRRSLAATAGELSPIVTGIVYCNTIAFCRDAYELRHAREWTEALTGWCERQPEMVAHNGLCLVHRAEIMQLQGAWDDALRRGAAAPRALHARASSTSSRAARRSTARARSTACGASSPRPRRRTGRRAGAGASHSRAWRSCAWPRARRGTRPARSAASSGRRREPLSGPRCCPPTSRSCSPSATSRQRACRPASSSRRSPSARRTTRCARWLRRPGARWPRRGRRAGGAGRAAPARAGLAESSARRTRRRARACSVGLACRGAAATTTTAVLELEAAREVFARLGAARPRPGSRRHAAAEGASAPTPTG